MSYNPSKTWFTSDNHHRHTNILKYSNRPFTDMDDMERALIENWNRVVKPDDTVFNLGDFAFCKFNKIEEILRQLNGEHHFILGNHDQEIFKNKQYLLDEGLVKSISSYREIYVGNQFINLFHYGCRVWNKSHHGAWLLYGHSHGTLPPQGKSVDVGMDADFILNGERPYRPYSFYEVKDFMDKQSFVKVDD